MASIKKDWCCVSLPLLSQIVCMPCYVSDENGAESAAGKTGQQ